MAGRGQARQGEARRGAAGQGKAWQGEGFVHSGPLVLIDQRTSNHGRARRGGARQGEARRGWARQGKGFVHSGPLVLIDQRTSNHGKARRARLAAADALATSRGNALEAEWARVQGYREHIDKLYARAEKAENERDEAQRNYAAMLTGNTVPAWLGSRISAALAEYEKGGGS